MRICFDFHNVIDAYPAIFTRLAERHIRYHDEVHVISAIGPKRRNTIRQELDKLDFLYSDVHEVVFGHPSESPALKTAKAVELGLTIFYDDRQDVCDAMNQEN